MAEISVIVPVYKVEKTLDRCIRSVIGQTFSDLEIILVDDGSPDGCPAMCDEWAGRDDRIRVLHKKNGGLSSARNAGIDAAVGDYVFFIDSDDEILPDTIETLRSLAASGNCDMAFGRFVRVYEGSDNAEETAVFSGAVSEFDEDAFWEQYYAGFGSKELHDVSVNMIISCNKLIKRAALGDLKFEDGRLHEDEFIIHKLVGNCKKIVFTDTKQYLYYQNPSGIMSAKSVKSAADGLTAYGDRCGYFAKKGKEYTLRSFEVFEYRFQKDFEILSENADVKKQLLGVYRSAYKAVKPYLKDASSVDRALYSTMSVSPVLRRLTEKLLSLYERLKGKKHD